MARDYFKGKRFLITQSSLTQFAGSEIVALELASFLNEHSAKTTVFTWAYDGAIKSEFEKLNINVITNEEKLHLKDFDYIWVQHQVIPSSILKELTDSPSYPKPIFLFYHMATLSHIWIEQPYANTIEKDLSSSSLFVSTEALEKNTTLFSNLFHNPQVFPNFIPQHFLSKEEASNTLKKSLLSPITRPKSLSTQFNYYQIKGYK